MSRKATSFRVGRVQAYRRGHIWYLCYHENGQRRRPRVGPDGKAARQLCAQINAQLASGAPAVMSFEPLSLTELRDRWLAHHEQVLRSSVQTIDRYRTATAHLLRFTGEIRPVRLASQFRVEHAEEFVCYLRTLRVSPNGHANTLKRLLLDKGLVYILECCRALFNYAGKRRHLPPYAENPFAALETDRIPVEHARPVHVFTPEQEAAFLQACDDWQFPVFLTFMFTGLRPGELTHLLLPEDLDLEKAVLRVRNKPRLGWQVKTRNERDIPLLPVLQETLRVHVGTRGHGPVFRRRSRSGHEEEGVLHPERELATRVAERERNTGQAVSRKESLRLAQRLWRELGALRPEWIRVEFMRLTQALGLADCTAPKMLRHGFATALQEGRVDPLIRNELMGHVAAGSAKPGHGLAMTAVYTHSRPETRRQQLEAALLGRPAVAVAQAWLLQAREHMPVITEPLAR